MTGTLLTSFLALMVTGIPVAIAMATASLIYIWVSGTSPPMVVVHRMISGIDSFPLLAVPFFILAGNLMNNAGITNRCLLYTSPSPRDRQKSRMPSSA